MGSQAEDSAHALAGGKKAERYGAWPIVSTPSAPRLEVRSGPRPGHDCHRTRSNRQPIVSRGEQSVSESRVTPCMELASGHASAGKEPALVLQTSRAVR